MPILWTHRKTTFKNKVLKFQTMIIYLYIFACRWRTILCSPVLKINKKYECEERFNTQKNLYSRCEYSNRTGVRTNNWTETLLKRWSRSASKWTLVWLNGWTNELMTLSTRGVLLSFWFTCKKGGVKANRTKQK